MKHRASCGCIKVKPQVAERESERGGRGKLKKMCKGGLATFDKLLLAALTTSTWFIIHYKPTHKRRVCVCALVHMHVCV